MPPVSTLKQKTGLNRPQNLPFLQNDQLLQPVPPQEVQQAPPQPANTLGQAQTLAGQAAQPDKTLGIVERQAQQLIQQPQPIITDQNVQSQLDKGARLRGEGFKQFRQGAADTSGTRGTREAAFNLALRGAQEQTDLEQQLKQNQTITNRQAQIENLNLGQDVARTKSGLRTEAINRLLGTRAAEQGTEQIASSERLGFAQIASGEKLAALDNETKVILTELGGKIQAGQQLADQDFARVEEALNRAHEQALADGNNELARDIEKMRGDLQREGFASSEKVAFARIASDEIMQGVGIDAQEALVELKGLIDSGAQLSDQDFQRTETALNRALQQALADGDDRLARDIETLRGNLAREGFASSEKVAFARIASDENMQQVGIDAQNELTELKGRIDSGLLIQSQDFEGAQSALDRDLQTAISNNDNATRLTIENMQADLAKEMQKADLSYRRTEGVLSRIHSTNERIGQNEFARMENLLDRRQQTAEATKDRDLTKQIESDRAQLQLKLQTNDMSHDEKITLMDAEIATAKADDDVGRQQELMKFSHGQEMAKIANEQGFQKSLTYLNDKLLVAREEEDFYRTKVLTNMQFDQEMKLHQSISAVDQAKIEMQQQGLDIAQFESNIAELKDAVLSGRLDPSVLTNYQQTVMASSLPDGFEFTEPDQGALHDALAADYVNQQFQWALTIGDADGDGKLDAGTYEIDEDGNERFVGLNNENQTAFGNHLAETIYNVEGGSVLANKRTDIKATGDYNELATNDELYQSFLQDITVPRVGNDPRNHHVNNREWGFVERFKGDGGKARSTYSMFEKGGFVNIDGTLLYVDSISRSSQAGDDDTNYVLTNPRTNETVTITASDRNDNRRQDLSRVLTPEEAEISGSVFDFFHIPNPTE